MRFHPETERLILRNLTPKDRKAAVLWCGGPLPRAAVQADLRRGKEETKGGDDL